MERPNILLVQVDQLTPFTIGAYGHPKVKTPHMDALAREGVRFDAAYTACPVCAPSRATMMTGKYSSTTGAYDNAALLPADEPTMGHYLTLAGYDAVVSGKLHFVGPDQLHGFHRRLTPDIYPSDFRWSWMMGPDGKPANQAPTYLGSSLEIGTWNDGLSYDEEIQFRALEYLRAQSNAQRKSRDRGARADPFFLFVSFHHPHEPFWPPKRYWDLYSDDAIELPDMPENLHAIASAMDGWLNTYHNPDALDITDPHSMRRVWRAYLALVTYVDDKLGELMQTLREGGLLEDTLVVFTSDHGDMLGQRGMIQKRYFYEWSARVPLIVRFPDGSHAGRKVPEPVNLIDLLPTFLDVAGVSEEARLPMDGRSLIGLLDGTDAANWEAISETHSDAMIKAPCFMLRQGDLKYIYIHGYPCQLFDLAEDPDELNNLVGIPEIADIEKAMRSRILELFDIDAIAVDVRESVAKRRLIDAANRENGVSWDYTTNFDVQRKTSERYLRAGRM